MLVIPYLTKKRLTSVCIVYSNVLSVWYIYTNIHICNRYIFYVHNIYIMYDYGHGRPLFGNHTHEISRQISSASKTATLIYKCVVYILSIHLSIIISSIGFQWHLFHLKQKLHVCKYFENSPKYRNVMQHECNL